MKFEKNEMYKNIFKDVDVAFTVDEILAQNHHGADLIVTWYKYTANGRWVSVGVSGEFHIPKDSVLHYVPV